MELREQLIKIAKLRQQLACLKEEKERAYSAWVAANEMLLSSIEIVNKELLEAETRLRQSALEGFEADGNPKPVTGVAIKMFTRVNYLSVDAYQWAVEHKMALQLNVSAFEKIAKASPMEFVQITEEPQAQIATDLTKYVTIEPKCPGCGEEMPLANPTGMCGHCIEIAGMTGE